MNGRLIGTRYGPMNARMMFATAPTRFLQTASVVLIALGWMIAPAAGQARTAKNVQQAVELAPDQGGMVAVLVYGSDWNPASVVFLQQVFNDSKLSKSLPAQIVLTSVDRPEAAGKDRSPESRNENTESVRRELPDVDIRTYPSILILDGVGRLCEIMMPAIGYKTPDDLAPELSKRHQQITRRDELLAKAELASGVDRAKLIGEAIREGGVGMGVWLNDVHKPALEPLLQLMKIADPLDQSGWILPTEFPMDAIGDESNRLLAESGLASAEKKLNEILSNSHLTADQRQQIQRQRFLLYKSSNQSIDRQIEILELVVAEKPESVIGRGAANWAKHLAEKK